MSAHQLQFLRDDHLFQITVQYFIDGFLLRNIRIELYKIKKYQLNLVRQISACLLPVKYDSLIKVHYTNLWI